MYRQYAKIILKANFLTQDLMMPDTELTTSRTLHFENRISKSQPAKHLTMPLTSDFPTPSTDMMYNSQRFFGMSIKAATNCCLNHKRCPSSITSSKIIQTHSLFLQAVGPALELEPCNNISSSTNFLESKLQIAYLVHQLVQLLQSEAWANLHTSPYTTKNSIYFSESSQLY